MVDVMDRAEDQPISDRERIASAMGELADRGYLLPFAAWDICCPACGWSEVARQTGTDDALPVGLKTVWWDRLSDSYAFCNNADAEPHTAQFVHTGHTQESQVDSVVARLTEFNTLVAPLYIHWRGDQNEIAAALRSQGLRVQVPPALETCVSVLPARSRFNVRPVDGEVLLSVDGEDVQLTVADAKRLARQLAKATRQAEMQIPIL